MGMNASQVMDALLRTHKRARTFAEKDSDQMSHQGEWRGLGFMVNGRNVVAAMDELTEILSYPDRVTPVPGAASWLKGLTNYHGEVLPITDLAHFTGGEPVRDQVARKLLVVKDRGVFYGFLVPQVLGIQYFPAQSIQKTERADTGIERFSFEKISSNDGGHDWLVVSMASLVYDKKFLMEQDVQNTQSA